DEVRTFATLSPLPRFRAWLAAELTASQLTPFERDVLGDGAEPVVTLADQTWTTDREVAERIRPGLLSAAARYLLSTPGGRAVDPVAHFHLSNGASVERLNWLANPAVYGIDESLGLMVNYVYDREWMATNADAYLSEGVVRASAQIRNLVKPAKG